MDGQALAELGATAPHEFTTTHWSVVLAAADPQSPRAAEALEQLCRTYWYPLYAYVRRRGHPPEDAQDLVQEFFARLLHTDGFINANADKGRFRSYLLGALNHFLANEWRRARAARRGGGHTLVSLDDPAAEARYAHEPVSETTPERLYERRWALTLFDRAMVRLQAEWTAAGRSRQFEALKQFLASEATRGEYTAVAADLNLTNPAVAMMVHRLRQRYGDLVREEIAHTVESPAEREEELRHLLVVLHS